MRDARQFLAEIEVKENSKLLNLKIENNNINELDNSNILFIQRGEHAFYPPIHNLVLKVGDVIVLGQLENHWKRELQNSMTSYNRS